MVCPKKYLHNIIHTLYYQHSFYGKPRIWLSNNSHNDLIYHLSKTDDIYLNEKCGVHDALSSVWNIPHNIPKTERVHPTQMPEALVERILKVASKGDELIYDSFMGSGTTAIVCNKFGLKWIGSEMNPENFEIAEKRLQQYLNQQKIF